MGIYGRGIAFRTDASVEIGSGHVMRCLTLADALADAGANCQFVMRSHTGHLGRLVQDRGHRVAMLPSGDGRHNSGLAHAKWLGTDWQTDASQSLAVVSDLSVDLLIIDHYALDRNWQAVLREVSPRVMVIDDLADRVHFADILLDQNLGTRAVDYAELLPPDAVRLIGPQYALVRPEFTKLREQCKSTRANRPLQRIVVAMGGTDPENISGWVLDQLDLMELPNDITIAVVLGANAPNLDAVARRAARMHHRTETLVGVADMSIVFAEADLCIGAAGGMSWERCCLGLPTILLVLADNQSKGAQALAQAHAGFWVGDVRQADLKERFWAQVAFALDPCERALVSRHAFEICDGLGVHRIVDALAAFWID